MYQRRAPSTRAGTGNAGLEEGETVTAAGVAKGVGGVVVGVHEATASTTVNTCARYLKVT